jgi:chromosome segregation ATPase
MEEACDSYTTKLNAANSTIQNLNTQLESLSKELAAVKSLNDQNTSVKCIQLETECNTLQSKLNNLCESIKQKDLNHDITLSKLQTLIASNMDDEKRISELKSKLNTLTEQYTGEQIFSSSLSKQLDDAKSSIALLKEEISNLQKSNELYRRDHDIIDANNRNLKLKHETKSKLVDDLYIKLKVANECISNYVNIHDTQKTTIDNLKSTINTLNSIITIHTEENNTLQSQLDNSNYMKSIFVSKLNDLMSKQSTLSSLKWFQFYKKYKLTKSILNDIYTFKIQLRKMIS